MFLSTSGWLGYSNEKIKQLAEKFMDAGFDAFKVKVGKNLYEDIQRLEFIRNIIGWDKTLVNIFILINNVRKKKLENYCF